jgi:hypothetical protein
MLSERNELIASAILIVYISFVPCHSMLREFFATPVGKAIALGVFVYVYKYVSCVVAVLLLVNFLRSGGVREYLDETGLTPGSVPTSSAAPDEYSCPEGFTYVDAKKMCMKGNDAKPPVCADSSMMWNSDVAKCISKAPSNPEPTTGNGGPEGGSTPGAMAAKNELKNMLPSSMPTKEAFTPYAGKETNDFAPL